MILHEIMPDSTYYQERGISWDEEATRSALDTIPGCPICAQFLDINEVDGKSEPWDHGLTGEIITDEGRMPIFTNSEVVGSLTKGYITDIEINGESKRVCKADGYIYQHRVPRLVDWLNENVDKEKACVSIEICGNADNNNIIIYKNGATATDVGRQPLYYAYSGVALLHPLVKPADPIAKVTEINSQQRNKIESEEIGDMDEKTLNLITDSVKATIAEINSKNETYETKIEELNSTIVELNASVDQLRETLTTVEKERDENWKKSDELYKEADLLREEIAKAKVKERIGELNSVLANFTDSEKEFAKDEITAFNENPMSVEINSIVTKIESSAYRKAKELQRTSEINSAKTQNNVEDIFGDVSETNSANNAEDDNIF